MADVDGYILAGGASSRMGVDKAHLQLGHQNFVERIAQSLSRVATRTSVVSNKPDAGVWGLPVVKDVYKNCGALGGIHAALVDAQAEWAMIVSCDLPFATDELFQFLVSQRTQSNQHKELFQAVAPVQPDGRPQPLCALYARQPCAEQTTKLLESGELRPRELLKQVRTRWVESKELCHLRGAALFFMNVNTPQDYRQALEQFKQERLADVKEK